MNVVQKQYTGIIRDHSASMSSHASAAKQDYNDLIDTIKTQSDLHDIDTIVSTIKCGVGTDGHNEREIVNSSVSRLKHLTSYKTDGSYTPLFDSVGELIDLLEKTPDSKDANVAFLVMVVTDGADNHSVKWGGRSLGDRIVRLQSTDRWTFTFRVPYGQKSRLVQVGIPAGNIEEWNVSDTRDYERTSRITGQAVSNYYGNLSRGIRSTDSFYADLGSVSKTQVKSVMTNISSEVSVYVVTPRDQFAGKAEIAHFVERKTGNTYVRGTGFYELVKNEKAVQSNKLIVIRSLKDGAVYAGQSARDLLGLPTSGTIKLLPGNHGDWEIYVQSRSSNRILPIGSKVLYWQNAR